MWISTSNSVDDKNKNLLKSQIHFHIPTSKTLLQLEYSKLVCKMYILNILIDIEFDVRWTILLVIRIIKQIE